VCVACVGILAVAYLFATWNWGIGFSDGIDAFSSRNKCLLVNKFYFILVLLI